MAKQFPFSQSPSFNMPPSHACQFPKAPCSEADLASNGELIIDESTNDYYTISNGFHSYGGKNIISVWLHIKTIGIYGMGNICRLLQTYNNFDDERDIVIVRCIIPEGYAYYENEDGEIVSDGISVTEDYISCGKLRDYMRKSIIEVFTTIDKLFDLLMTSE